MRNLISLYVVIFFLSILVVQAFAQDHSKLEFNCSLCHSCETPTKSDPCLVVCPREQMMTVHISPEKSPKIIKMQKLESVQDIYEPVIFSHRIHAEMSEMSGGCEMCHHYNPPGNIVACDDCHEPQRQRVDISKPDLKAAYHRQCIDCHQTWSENVPCESCHETNESGKSAFTDKEYDSDRVHPEIVVPNKIVYETPEQKNTLVTFFHNEHTDLYGLDCRSCHQEESCAKCHDPRQTTAVEKVSLQVKHEKCIDCHDTEAKSGCESCHTNKEMKPFNHGTRTGFALKSYHTKLNCTQCHQSKGVFTGLSSSCTSCHSGWDSETFDHKITGLALDEMHSEFDCGDCHPNADFSKKPSCEDCHDDMSYPEYKPGALVKK
jgi:hypothetical protein